ncbi:hypothetical protein DA2_2004 [Desulfovibrio sp. A2]|nr:hypothetical protein DA2_2004 [Desulfovibrio sp. A2]
MLAGTIDDLPPDARFDIIVLADVIEHVETPVQLLRACAARLSPQGLLAVLTPDCRSLAARLLGWRWWHYRIAHINYFDRHTLAAALSAADLEPVRTLRPGWRFTMQYLCERLEAYVPKVLIPRFLYSKRISIPLNLRDSLMVIATKRP